MLKPILRWLLLYTKTRLGWHQLLVCHWSSIGGFIISRWSRGAVHPTILRIVSVLPKVGLVGLVPVMPSFVMTMTKIYRLVLAWCASHVQSWSCWTNEIMRGNKLWLDNNKHKQSTMSTVAPTLCSLLACSSNSQKVQNASSSTIWPSNCAGSKYWTWMICWTPTPKISLNFHENCIFYIHCI